jgi:hypothetical protein
MEYTKLALDSQGEKWRRLLSGEIRPLDLLTAGDYRQAAARLLGRLRSLIWSFVRRFWILIAIVLAVTGTVIWAIIRFAPSGTATVVALIAAAAGSLGVSWKTVASTLGQVISKAEQPLWDAEVLESVVVAATVPPLNMGRRTILKWRKATIEAGKLPRPAALEQAPQQP